MTSLSKKIPLFILASFLLAAPAAFAKKVIDNDFEKGVPREYSPDKNFKIATDTVYARSGKYSLHLAKNAGSASNAVYYDLDGRMNFVDACEFSVWVYTKSKTRVAIYISTDDGGGRYNVAEAHGTLTPGKWCQMKGVVHAGDWRKQDQQTRFVIRSYGECWVDDVLLETSTTVTPAQAWPRLKAMIQSRTAKRISTVKLGDTLTLDARNAVLAPDTARVEVSLPDTASTIIPEEGLLVFAINATEDIALTGSLQLEPDADLRPGLRVTVLADDTVIAAPAVKAKAWKGTQSGNRPGPAPNIKGERPSSTVPLAPFRLSKGRHYITVAGPHIRSGGTFAKLELQAAAQPAEKPLYTFGLLSDTHLGSGRPEWMNLKLNAQAGAELEAALRQLKREGAGFAIIAGDMTDAGRRSQYDELSRIVKRANLPVYGCLGNHDTFRDSRKKDIAETIPKLFPNGPANTDYAFSKAPLRFIVLDGSHWYGKDTPVQGFRGGKADKTTYLESMSDWLRATLAADTTTPTIVISHYEFFLNRGVSPVSGYDLGKGSVMDKKLMVTLAAAPNVVATMNGHYHYNAVGSYHGITSIQNPAFVEWPNAYRVCRVYADRMEWEVRQMSNRGLLREGVVPKKNLLWMLSTTNDDLAGTVKLAPRTPVTTVIDEDFEGSTPPRSIFGYRVSRDIDTTRAHSGKSSLRVKTTGKDWGTVGYDLDKLMDFSAAGEISLWVYAESAARVSAYVSAQAIGNKDRHTVARLAGKIEPGKWCQLKAQIPAGYWRMDEKDVRLVVRTHGECWIDGVKMSAKRPDR